MAKQVVYYVKFNRRNGQTGLLCEPGSNKPQVFTDLDQAKIIASEAKKIMTKFNLGDNHPTLKNNFPAEIEKIWIFKTYRSV